MKSLKSFLAIMLCMLMVGCLQTQNGYLSVSVKIFGNAKPEQTTINIFYEEEENKSEAWL
jgi:hypothetical protein